VDGGALPKSAGSSFHGRKKPNGSACQRRIMAGVQDEAKHAISALWPLKSENRELSDRPGVGRAPLPGRASRAFGRQLAMVLDRRLLGLVDGDEVAGAWPAIRSRAAEPL
jgi:hypothetical protein